MAVKPQPNINAFIHKGGEVAKDNTEENVIFTLRVPKTMVVKIDAQCKGEIKLPRNTWILQAIQEKLKKGE